MEYSVLFKFRIIKIIIIATNNMTNSHILTSEIFYNIIKETIKVIINKKFLSVFTKILVSP